MQCFIRHSSAGTGIITGDSHSNFTATSLVVTVPFTVFPQPFSCQLKHNETHIDTLSLPL
jgi:hypothetical protein